MKRIAMMLLVTTISAAGILPFVRAACAQVTDHSAKTDDPAELEIRKLNAQEVEPFSRTIQNQWRVCGQTIS